VSLTSPQGTVVVLHDNSGGSTNDLVTTYDTETEPDGPGSMADFDGENPAGSWTLHVSDHYGWDTGDLNSWSLDITPLVPCDTGGGSLIFADGFESGDTTRWSASVS